MSAARPLLHDDHPVYLKRFARELNALEDGFYLSSGARYSTIRYREGRLQVYAPLPGDGPRAWYDVKVGETFRDAYGRNVTASRAP